MDVFVSEKDTNMGKILKYYRPNPVGEDIYLMTDGSIVRDEDKIVSAQRIFKHNYWRPEGPGALRVLEKYTSGAGQEPMVDETIRHPTKMAATHIIISDLSTVIYPPLIPAPSVRDEFAPPMNPTGRGLLEGPLLITSNYRGHTLYLENGALLYRSDPKSPGGNGMVSFPTASDAVSEPAFICFENKWWRGTINFVSCPAESV